MSSIGFKSVEYGGKNTKLMSSSLANSNVSCAVCGLELSSIPIIVDSGLGIIISLRKPQNSQVFDSSLNSITGTPLMRQNSKAYALYLSVFLAISGLWNDHSLCVLEVV
jgi:hypothetical protein